MIKRFEVVLNEFDEVEYIMDKEMMEDRDFAEFIDFVEDVCKENEELKQYAKQVLQNHLDGWRGVYNPIDESIVVEISVVKSIAEDLGVDLE